MFKSIEYIRYDQLSYSYIYKLIDSDFECTVSAASSSPTARRALAIISEYKRRNLPVLSNLFLYNLYICKKYNYSFEESLEYQNKYVDKYYPNIKFSNIYYNDLKNMWDKYNILT